MSLHVELLTTAGCPNTARLLPRLRQLLAAHDLSDDVEVVLVHDDEEAVRRCFPGSPTVRINGVDVDPPVTSGYGVQCRLYVTADGLRGTPDDGAIAAAISAAR